jgi:hypothetical protein
LTWVVKNISSMIAKDIELGKRDTGLQVLQPKIGAHSLVNPVALIKSDIKGSDRGDLN